MPLIPALRKQRQVGEFKASLVYRVSYRKGFKTTEKPCLKRKKQKAMSSSFGGGPCSLMSMYFWIKEEQQLSN